MGKLIIEGPDSKLDIIETRFRNFGVKFTRDAEPSSEKPKKETKPKQNQKPDK